jgi:lipopolysaccharide/colanic/teichoic acid biosynthesis glycosyltransferase
MDVMEIKVVETFWELSFRPAVVRFLDIIIASLLLVGSLPLWIFAAVAIKLSGPGPVFYSHYRLGKDRVPFKLVKFRTMVLDAEKDGPRWAQENDRRITPIGRFLRRYRIDELPQFLTIIQGDLSLVGPRPIREYAANILKQHDSNYDLRFSVKPGLTGWAQICAPYGSTIENQLQALPYDLRYLHGLSVAEYFGVLLLTAKTVLMGKGC